MILKRLLTACALVLSINTASAATIEYAGYSHDTNTNIVKGGGLEWLQWDETIGQSIDQALSTYANDGWQLASNQQMSTLFNSFDFGFTFTSNESLIQHHFTGSTPGENPDEKDRKFISIFGNTNTAIPGPFVVEGSSALFGSDMDGDGLYNIASVVDDVSFIFPIPGSVSFFKDIMNDTFPAPAGGVALVRTASVPEPASFALLLMGVAGIAASRKRKG